MATKAWAFDSPLTYSAADFRQGVIGGLFAHSGSVFTPAQGIISGLAASGIGTSLSWTLTGGLGLISGTNLDSDGCAVFRFDTATVTHAARDATYTRIDLVGIAINWTTGILGLTVTKGVPSASPVEPAQPAAPYLPLYKVTVPAGGGALAAQDLRPRAAALGAPVTCTSATRPGANQIYPGFQIFETNTTSLRCWDGSRWALMGEQLITSGIFSPDPNIDVLSQRAVVRDRSVTVQLQLRTRTHNGWPFSQYPVGVLVNPRVPAGPEATGVATRDGFTDAAWAKVMPGNQQLWLSGFPGNLAVGTVITVVLNWLY